MNKFIEVMKNVKKIGVINNLRILLFNDEFVFIQNGIKTKIGDKSQMRKHFSILLNLSSNFSCWYHKIHSAILAGDEFNSFDVKIKIDFDISACL